MCPRGDLNPHAPRRALAPQASASAYSATRTSGLAALVGRSGADRRTVAKSTGGIHIGAEVRRPWWFGVVTRRRRGRSLKIKRMVAGVGLRGGHGMNSWNAMTFEGKETILE